MRTLDPAVAVIAESPPPEDVGQATLWFPSGVSKLGILVWTAGGYRATALPRADLPNCVVPLRIDGPESFNLLAVWTWPAPTYLAALNNALVAYSSLLSADVAVVMGDFNGNPIYDKPRQKAKWTDTFNGLQERGMVSAYHHVHHVAYGSEPSATHHFQRKPFRPFHIDYCFVPRAWAKRGLKTTVHCDGDWKMLSDHFPLVVDVPAVPTEDLQEDHRSR